jgi:hypothetical protein
MGDISTACSTLNYSKLSRNFYEISHAKGPKDATGGFLKKQADLAVLNISHTITTCVLTAAAVCKLDHVINVDRY